MKLRKTADTQNLRRLENEIKRDRQGDEEGDLGEGLRARGLPARARDRDPGGDRADEDGRAATRRRPSTSRARDIEEVISSWTGIPVTSLQMEEAEKLLHMEETLKKRVDRPGPLRSARSAAPSAARASASKNPNRPMGSFIFLGPSGVGKTEVARRLAEFLFDHQKALVRFDMSRVHGEARGVQADRLASRLRRPRGGRAAHGADPPPALLRRSSSTRSRRRIPTSRTCSCRSSRTAQLTDAYGNSVDFKNTLIIMTSNIGTKYLVRAASRMGFGERQERARAARGRGDGPQGAPARVLARVHQPDRRGHRLQSARPRASCARSAASCSTTSPRRSSTAA